jgi:hypothetical protein
MQVVLVTRLAINPLADSARLLRRLDDKERANRWRTPSWFTDRVSIFSQCAVQSVRNLISPPDHWVIVLDTTHKIAFGKIRPTLRLPDFAGVLLLKDGDNFQESLRTYLQDFGQDVLTIRLDSDDLLSPGFVSLAKRKSRPNHGINFPHGVQLFLDGVLVHRWINSNPMVGFRAVGNSLHVHDFGQHRNVGRIARMVSQPTLMPMWLKTSHHLNHVPFQPNGIPVVNRGKVGRLFGLSEKNFPANSQFLLKTFISHLGWRLNKNFPKLAIAIERGRRVLFPSTPDSRPKT